jgi:hypothetical protein
MFGEYEDYEMFAEAYRVIKQYMRRGWVSNLIYFLCLNLDLSSYSFWWKCQYSFIIHLVNSVMNLRVP